MRARKLVLVLLLLLFPCVVFAAKNEPESSRALLSAVAVDVGHSLPRWGATSARGLKEYEFNAVLARRVLEELHAVGLVKSFLLDSKHTRRNPRERTRLAREQGAALLLSIHHDSVQPHYLQAWTFEGKELKYCNKFQGYSLFYSEKNPLPGQSLRLARDIGAQLRLAGFTPTAHHAEAIPGENREFVDPGRGVYRFDDLLVLKTARMPAVLVEAGVIVNSIEERALQNPARQQRMARAVALGVAKFLGLALGPSSSPFSPPRLQQ